jgi:hypothetical protein
MTPLIIEVFPHEKIPLQDAHLPWKEHPLLMGGSGETHIYVTMTQIY